MADSTCSTHGWSILNSAPTNSALAGVLAGFAFTAGVIYIGRAHNPDADRDADPQAAERHFAARSLQDVQTISLFTASFVILGLNSFVWGIVAGHRPFSEVGTTAAEAAELCQRVWSQAVVAAGMISLGAIAMVCNITSLFFWQRVDLLRENDRRYLKMFLLLVQAGAVLGVIAFVGSDSFNFLHVVYQGAIPVWFSALTLCVTFGGLAVALYVGVCHYYGRTAFAPARTARSRMKDRMRIPTALIVVYAVLGAVAVTIAAQYPRWPSEPTNEIIVAYWLLGVVYPVVVVIMVARGIPPAKGRYSQSRDLNATYKITTSSTMTDVLTTNPDHAPKPG